MTDGAIGPVLNVNDRRTRLVRRAGSWYAATRRRLSRRVPRADVVVEPRGPAWFHELLVPTATLGDRHLAERRGLPLIVLDVGDVAPFVQPALSNPVIRSWPEGLPADYEALARAASLLAGGPAKERHVAYRAAQRSSASALIDRRLQEADRPLDTSDREVTVVCVTERPHHIGAVLDQFAGQTWGHKRLLVVTNSHAFDTSDVDERVHATAEGVTIHTDPSLSLGACLNLALDRTSTRYVAKVDDDDRYGPSFLEDLMIAHRFAGAGVVGKHSYFAHLSRSDRTILRFPDGEFRYTPYLAGGTLVIDREQTGSLRFPDVSIGEDQGFILASLRRGISTFSADRFNYVQERGSENTWQASDEAYLTSYAEVDPGEGFDAAVV